VADRALYRAIRKGRFSSVLEIGIGSIDRARNMIQIAAMGREPDHVSYAGIDLFETRPMEAAQRLSLKGTHQALRGTGARIRLIPGEVYSALARTANELVGRDLLIISADHDTAALDRAWFYVPRLLHADSQVFLEVRDADSDTSSYRRVPRIEIERLAATYDRRAA